MKSTTIESVQSIESTTTQENMKDKTITIRTNPSDFEEFKQLQIELGMPNQQETFHKLMENWKETHKPKTPKPERELEGLSWTDLKKLRGDDATGEKILRAFNAIKNHNDKQPSNESRWYISNTTLGHICGCNSQTITKWLGTYKTSVDDANSKYGLGQYHNMIHKGRDINEFLEEDCLEPSDPTTPATT